MVNDSSAKKPIKEILYDGYYYDVTEWVKRHPGGKIIEFYTKPGEDATIAVKQFHHRSSDRVMAIMKTLKKRPALDTEIFGESGSGSAVSTKYKALTEDYMRLYKEFLDEGLFKPSILHVVLRISEVLALGLMARYCYFTFNPFMAYVGVILAGLGCARTAYLVHESGHRSLTGKVKIDKVLESFGYGYFLGMCSSYWDHMHNRHHAFPQRMQHDVDLDTLPLIAFNKEIVKGDKKAAQYFWIRNQAFLFHVVDTFLVGLFWKFFLHPRYAIHKRAYFDLFFMTAHNLIPYWYGISNYLLIGWIAGMILFGNFALSHTHTPVTSEKESRHWVQYAFEHTVNISHNRLCDWWMGYLNYQIEHHLFPQIPHFRLKRIKQRVIELAKKHDLPYICLPYFEAVKLNLANLAKVSKEVQQMQ